MASTLSKQQEDSLPQAGVGANAQNAITLPSTVVVSSLAPDEASHFEPTALEEYRKRVLAYGIEVFADARQISLDRSPKQKNIRISKADVNLAAFRVEHRLARLRQIRFPFKGISTIVSWGVGFLLKWAIDSKGSLESTLALLAGLIVF